MNARTFKASSLLIALATAGMVSLPAYAVVPVVKTVPWVATNPLIPHTTFSGKSVRLKGTTEVPSPLSNFEYMWDFGDGNATGWGTVVNPYILEASHTYAGPVGTVYTARLTVRDKSTGDTSSKTYFVEMKDKNLDTEVNVAIDEGLWYLHKEQRRYTSGGVDFGAWDTNLSWGAGSGQAIISSSYQPIVPTNVNAFLVNGHKDTGSADNPYTETVARGIRQMFSVLNSRALSNQNDPINGGTYNPDYNGNGIGVYYPSPTGHEGYENGPFVDAIVATGTPNALAPTGPANVVGRKYIDIVQDMVENMSFCQWDGGGWYYSCNGGANDNSISQWMAIGLLAGRSFGAVLPTNPGKPKPNVVQESNKLWLDNSQQAPNAPSFNNGYGYFGYTSANPIWGPYAVTPSGMVQMTLDGIGRGSSPANGPSWEGAETFIREQWDKNINSGAYYSIKDYYYGLFSFTKSMLLHDPDGNGVPNPIQCLKSSRTTTVGGAWTGPLLPDLDWYAADATNGVVDACSGQVPTSDGVARTLVNDQSGVGYWTGQNYYSTQQPFSTAWAIMMLNRTVFESGVPVAVAKAVPNPSVAGQLITLDGTDSFHQDSGRQIDSWQWDFNNDGVWDASGPNASYSWPALGNYPVKLRVTDNGSPEKDASTIVVVNVATPPLAPTANANGPYNFCPNRKPWFLDGTGSINPDDGLSEPGLPGDAIKSYEWDLDGNGVFEVSGAQPNVTDMFTPGSHLVQLKVTDNTGVSFPSSGQPDLSDTDSAEVNVLAATDPACTACINSLAARPKSGKVQLTWSPYAGAASYNVYRSTLSGGPYLKIANTASTYSTYLDGNVVNGTTYYYVVRAAAANGEEMCQSPQASAKPAPRK